MLGFHRTQYRNPLPRHVLLGLLAASLSVACGTDSPQPGAGVADFIGHLEDRAPAWMETYGIPGSSLALVVDGDLLWSRSFGYADPREDRVMELNAVYRVESLSKPVTAWGVMQLVEAGRVDLDDAVESRLSGFRLPPSEFDTDEVTVRRLLSGTAGFPLGTLGMEYAPGEPMPSLEDLLRQEARLVAPPGAGFTYSNPGFNLLELLVQEVTGQDFGEYMEARVLRPLGMADAVYGWSPPLAERIPVGHDLSGATVEHYTYPDRGAGGLFATVEDMARFAAAGMYGRPNGSDRVLEEASVRRLHTVEATDLGIYGLVADGYGLGHFVENLPDGQLAVFHGGQGNGWMTHIHWVPASGDGIVILTNSQRSWPFIARVLGDWATWRDVGPVGMERIIAAGAALKGLVVLILLMVSWRAWRLGRLVTARSRGTALPASRERGFGVAELLSGLGLGGLLLWAVTREYFFFNSVFPATSAWLGWSLALLAAVLVAGALAPALLPSVE